jgi:hypothetical protein
MIKRFSRIFTALLVFSVLFASKCKKQEDEDEFTIRDRKEQYRNEKDSILHFVQTHTYVVDAYNNIHIEPVHYAGQRTIYDDAQVIQMQDTAVEDLIYDIYFLPIAPGTRDTISTCDHVFVSYEVQNFDLETVFYHPETNPVWTSVWLPNLGVRALGMRKVLDFFKTGTYTVNGDGTVTFSGYGAGMAILPSGLANYEFAITGEGESSAVLPAYSPVIIKFKTLAVNTDIDRDHVPNVLEDLNGNGDPTDDNTDKESETQNNLPHIPDYMDADDDGDALPTKDEDPNGNGDPTDDDSDGDGIPNYLDADTH